MALFGVLSVGGLEAIRQGAGGLALCVLGIGLLAAQGPSLDVGCPDRGCFPGEIGRSWSAGAGYALAVGSAFFGVRSLSVMQRLRSRFGPSLVAGLRLGGMTAGLAMFASLFSIAESTTGPAARPWMDILVLAALLAIVVWLWSVVLAHLDLAAATVPAFLIPVLTVLLQHAWRAAAGREVSLASAASALGAVVVSTAGVVLFERRSPSNGTRKVPAGHAGGRRVIDAASG
jgi:hypothetical protein